MGKKELEKEELERLMNEKGMIEEKKIAEKREKAYEKSPLCLLTGAQTPEKACDVLKGERIIFTDPAGKRREGEIIGYWGERVVIEGKAFLFMKKRMWVPIEDVLSVIPAGEEKMAKMEETIRGLVEQIEKRKEDQKEKIKSMEIAVMASPALAVVEKNERQLERILCAASVEKESYEKMHPMNKVIVLKKGLDRLHELIEKAG